MVAVTALGVDRNSQLRDVRGIFAAYTDLDHAYLDEWANDLGVENLLKQVRS